MNERVRRPILSLKLGPSAAKPAEDGPDSAAPATAAPAAPAAYTWKCRPCGKAFVPPSEGPDDEAVRCPSCNARLGKAGDFRLDPPPLERLRARAVKAAPPKPAPAGASRPGGPRTRPPVVTVKVLKKVR